jgi:hypothetical protein
MNFRGHRLARTRECVASESRREKRQIINDIISVPFYSLSFYFIQSGYKTHIFLAYKPTTDLLCIH